MRVVEPKQDQLWKRIKTGTIVRIVLVSVHGVNSKPMVSYVAAGKEHIIFTREENSFRVHYVYVGEVPLPNRQFNARTVYSSQTHTTEMLLSDLCDVWVPYKHKVELGFDAATNWLLAIRLQGRYVRLDEQQGPLEQANLPGDPNASN